jgi:hypothetical protein
VRPDFKFIAILLLVASPVVAIVVINSVQRREVQRVTQLLTTTFPVGMSISEVQKTLISLYPGRTTTYTSAACEKWSHRTTPAYTSRGGPCIVGSVEVSGPRIADAAVTFKLIFGLDDHLAQLDTDPVYTFL